MTSIIDNPDVWRSFIFPFTQTLTSLAIATYSMKQERIARFNARRETSTRFQRVYQGFCSLFDATVKLQKRTDEWQSAWFQCRSAKEEAACLYGYYLDPRPERAILVNGYFEQGMSLCLWIVDHIELRAKKEDHAILINGSPEGIALMSKLNELSDVKLNLLRIMNDDIRICLPTGDAII